MSYAQRSTIRLWMVVAALFVACVSVAMREAKYALAGTLTTAELLDVTPITIRGRYSTSEKLRVHYRFTDVKAAAENGLPEGERRELDDMSMDWTPPVGGTLQVQYMAGQRGISRIAGHEQLWVFIPLVLALLGGGFGCYRFFKGYYEHQAAERRRAAP